ncbi:MAG: tRNA dihydrouridine synthase DusB [Thermoguttaceae bacterium]
MLRIGPLIIDPPLLSAPMAGYTNYAFRSLLRRLGGVGLIATEMVSAQAFVAMASRGGDEPLRLAGVRDEPRPLAVQIWDHNPEHLAELARRLAHEDRVSVVDLNFGCPAPQIAGKSMSGASLLRDPDKVGKIVAACVAVCGDVPVTAKIRLGWTRDSITAVEVARAVEEAGGAALTVHGRTASEMYRGHADWETIASIKPHLKRIPLIGNGDICTVDDAVNAIRQFAVDGIMIGRAAMGRPWIFSQIASALRGETPADDPTSQQQQSLLLDHFMRLQKLLPRDVATIVMRKYACHYAAGKRGARAFRTNISRAMTPNDLVAVIENEFPLG